MATREKRAIVRARGRKTRMDRWDERYRAQVDRFVMDVYLHQRYCRTWPDPPHEQLLAHLAVRR